MKVIVTPSGSPLVFPPLGGAQAIALDASKHEGGTVAEIADAQLRTLVAVAITKSKGDASKGNALVPLDAAHPFAYSDAADLMRDLRWIAKAIGREGAEDGTEVKIRATGRGYSLDFPPKAVAPIKVGDKIAVGPNISPKAMMNARGEVTAVNGTKATVRFDAGDIDRINRATGKRYAIEGRMPKVCLEVIA